MAFWDEKTILVTGGYGFLGSHVIEHLQKAGVHRDQISVPRSRNLDLRKWENCKVAVRNTDIVIHLAAAVGGIGFNQQYPGSIFYDNLVMGIQLMEAARQENVGKCVLIGTACSYPESTPVPFKEENLWDGFPEKTNAPYCIAKKTLLVQSQAYRRQYGFNSIFLLPVGLYGPRDNFEPGRSHVISALIRKFADAALEKKPVVEVWGTGSAYREFLYADDAARGIVLAAERYDKSDPVNLGSGRETLIRDVVNLIARETQFEGEITWNENMPEGRSRMSLDVTRAKTEFGFEAKISIEEGIRKTVMWYLNNKNP